MRTWLIFAGGILVVLLSIWSLAHVLPEGWGWLPILLYSLVTAGAGLGALGLRKRAERRNRTTEEGSIEREIAQRAASGTFSLTLVALVLFGLYLVVQDQFVHAFVLYLLTVGVIVAYWIRYAIIRRRLS